MGSDDSGGSTDSLGGSVAELLPGGLSGGDLRGPLGRGVHRRRDRSAGGERGT
ncbi:hypothetical protein [Haloglomus irregulare]|uniref:hypothetical protein n=1 Tax=Haloglomus irregulare TaxID=2234134 RepID=UPI00163DDDB3|nr:hypothetical protein [Haloglomus irregulare]